jgi:hypothetical protein
MGSQRDFDQVAQRNAIQKEGGVTWSNSWLWLLVQSWFIWARPANTRT